MTEQGQPGFTGEPEAEAAAEPAAQEDGVTQILQPLTTPPPVYAIPPGMVRLKVQPPHSYFGFGGLWVDDQGSSVVPQSALGGLMEAAADAGVTLTQEEG